MKFKLFSSLLLVVLLFQGCKKDVLETENFSDSSNFKVELSRDELNARIGNVIKRKNSISWNDLNNQELASAFRMAQVNIVTIAWTRHSSTDNEKDVILDKLQELEPNSQVNGEERIIEINPKLDFMDVRLENVETLIALRGLPQVESIDVYYNPLTEEQLKEGAIEIERIYAELQRNNPDSNRNGDPTTRDPNVGVFHNIDDAWNSPYMAEFGFGEGIKVAVVDVGIHPGNVDYGPGADGIISNENKTGYYKHCWWCGWVNYDGPYSQPNSFSTGALVADHGIGRFEEIAYPYGDGGLTGVAYEAEIMSVRATNSLAIDLSENVFSNVKAMQRAYEFLAGQQDVKIISMSNGALIQWSCMKNAIEDCKGSGSNEKLIFNAAGTFPLGVYAEMLLFDTSGEFTLFPASMPETEACSAITINGNAPPQYSIMAFGNSDFVSRHDGLAGTSSEGTAYTAGMAALIWGTNPSMTAQEVRNKMIQASTSPSHDFYTFGFGMVDMEKFIENEQNPTETLVSLKGSNNKFVSSNDGVFSMKCDRNSVGSWEKFTLVDAGDGKKALLGSNGKYVSSNNGWAAMKCDRNSIGTWEKFTLVDAGGGKYALRGSNGKFVSSNNGIFSMKCDRNNVGSWEKFTINSVN